MRRFRQAVRDGSVLIGTFVKTASHQVPEIIGAAGLDFAVIDAEHAPFDLAMLDRMAVAARGAGLPCLGRAPELAPVLIGQILDLGAAGVVAPHIATPEAARLALSAAKYAGRRRGFSPSTRAGGYGTLDAAAYRATADEESSVWCQIEDEAALSQLDAIAAVEQLDCLFLGRADLAVSLGVDSQRDPKVRHLHRRHRRDSRPARSGHHHIRLRIRPELYAGAGPAHPARPVGCSRSLREGVIAQ